MVGAEGHIATKVVLTNWTKKISLFRQERTFSVVHWSVPGHTPETPTRMDNLTTYTTNQAALILGISDRAVRKATGRGYLKHTIGEVGFGVTGRIFTPEDLTQYIERRKALFGRPTNRTIHAGSV